MANKPVDMSKLKQVLRFLPIAWWEAMQPIQMPATDYGFAMAVPSQKVEDFIRAVECFLRHIGGVPKILVPDNLKAAVIKRENGMPVLNKIFDDSVPYKFIGFRMQVVYTATVVKIYTPDGMLISL